MRLKNPGINLSLLFLLAGLELSGSAQTLNYPEIFGNDWQKALTFLEDNNNWIESAFTGSGVPYDEAVAIVFPELVRYSALRDKMEISMLKTLYRNLGDDYADFSIGVFQIKPSFAEEIHNRVFTGTDKKLKNLFRRKSSFPNTRLYRAYVIADLESPETEINYIIAFIKFFEKRFGKEWPDKELKIKLMATAYNTGILKNLKEIEALSEKKFFNTKIFKTENYSYCDVSLCWYNQQSHNFQ